VLRHENRMAAKRRLIAVISRHGRSQPLGNEIRRMIEHNWQTFGFQIGSVFPTQDKAAAKVRAPQLREQLGQVVVHGRN